MFGFFLNSFWTTPAVGYNADGRSYLHSEPFATQASRWTNTKQGYDMLNCDVHLYDAHICCESYSFNPRELTHT